MDHVVLEGGASLILFYVIYRCDANSKRRKSMQNIFAFALMQMQKSICLAYLQFCITDFVTFFEQMQISNFQKNTKITLKCQISKINILAVSMSFLKAVSFKFTLRRGGGPLNLSGFRLIRSIHL